MKRINISYKTFIGSFKTQPNLKLIGSVDCVALESPHYGNETCFLLKTTKVVNFFGQALQEEKLKQQ